MSTIARVPKSSGGVELSDGATIFAAELNGDLDGVYNLVNGNLDNTNLAAGAAVKPTQNAAFAASNAQFLTVASPGTTGALSIPATLDQEIARLRYKILELSLGTSAQLTTGAGLVAGWTDGTFRGKNLAVNGDFEGPLAVAPFVLPGTTTNASAAITMASNTGLVVGMAVSDGPQGGSHIPANEFVIDLNAPGCHITTGVGVTGNAGGAITFTPLANSQPPAGWTLVGTPTTCALVPTLVSDGAGNAVHVVCRASNADGITQTFANLKANTRYLVIARVAVNVGTFHMITTGAVAGSFANLNLVLTQAVSLGAYQTISGVVLTDAVPTSIVVNLVGDSDAAADDFDVDHFGIYEIFTDPIPQASEVMGTQRLIGRLPSQFTTTSFVGFGLTTTISVPGPGYRVRVFAFVNVSNTSGGVQGYSLQLRENGTSVFQFDDVFELTTQTSQTNPLFFSAYRAPGSYTYTVFGRSTGGTVDVNVTQVSGANGGQAESVIYAELVPPS